MLKIWGKIIKNGKLIKSETYVSDSVKIDDAMLESLEHFGRVFDIEVPLWQTNHTKQLGVFRKIIFRRDDFIDKIAFDKFEMEILEYEP